MKIIELVTEARKNPDRNLKSSINSELFKLYNETTDSVGGTKNLFISFTKLNKLGINPSSSYNTPGGIYAYPAEYVISLADQHSPMTTLLFAGEHPYGQTFIGHVNVYEFDDLNYWTKN